MCDVLSYIDYKNQKKIFEWVDKHLNKNGFFLFSYTQNDKRSLSKNESYISGIKNVIED
jgi:predicted TPR repeat methyltransferase